MSDEDYGTMCLRRCSTCGTNWAVADEFAECAKCGGDAELVKVARHSEWERAPSYGESHDLRAHIQREEQAQLAAEAEARERDLEPVIRAATAALNYDLGQWATPAGADWVADEGGMV